MARLLRSVEALARILRRVEALEFCGRVCAVLTFLRDKSRAPAAILVRAPNRYPGRPGFALASSHVSPDCDEMPNRL